MDLSAARDQMIGHQLRAWDIGDSRVLDVMGTVPRPDFVPAAYRNLAYADMAVPIGHGQEMLAPKIQGRLLQALELNPGDEVLDVGTGTGFLAACLARLAGQVTSIDIREDFTELARKQLSSTGVHGVRLVTGDIFETTFPRRFDAIAVTGSLPLYPRAFEDWLKPGGRMFCIVGVDPLMEATLVRKGLDSAAARREAIFETLAPALENAPSGETFRF
jgi:protein-L-isoaspartate(D-aspartate) O-methyltransferase